MASTFIVNSAGVVERADGLPNDEAQAKQTRVVPAEAATAAEAVDDNDANRGEVNR